MDKEKLTCSRCGWDGDEDPGCFSGRKTRRMYSCKANVAICALSEVIFCENCMEDAGGSKYPQKCPRCEIGAIKINGYA